MPGSTPRAPRDEFRKGSHTLQLVLRQEMGSRASEAADLGPDHPQWRRAGRLRPAGQIKRPVQGSASHAVEFSSRFRTGAFQIQRSNFRRLDRIGSSIKCQEDAANNDTNTELTNALSTQNLRSRFH
jgi:hypothetical protein